jgi:GTPase SAR1 family protein
MEEENKEIELAWQFVEHTNTSIFLTGKAGTGKTTFLKRIVENTSKCKVVVAPTGVAAINAGGVTIHSFFQLPLSPFIPNTIIKNKFDFSNDKRKIIRSLDLLIIDEISMVRSDLLDAIDSVLRRFRDHTKPFGGVQLLMIGDLQQLTPVVTNEEAAMLEAYYDTPYFFGSKALRQISYVTIELNKVYRQQNAEFLTLLNHIRVGNPSADDLAKLNERYQPEFRPTAEQHYIRLTTHNATADRYNDSELARLDKPEYKYNANVDGNFPEYSYPTDKQLTLRKGAQVMFIKNDPKGEYYNGKIGVVTSLDAKKIYVRCPDDGNVIEVTPQVWENAKYVVNPTTNEIETEIQGTFSQFPLRLAWAITIHKSQGLTFEHAIIDAGRSFAPGQVYVALSRCRTLEGLVLASKLSQHAIINDVRVESYISHQHIAAAESINQLPQLKRNFMRHQLLELFNFTEVMQNEDRLMRLFIENFSHQFPQLTLFHKATLKSLQEQLNLVAYKWTMLIQKMTDEQLHEAPFLERVQKSCDYFRSTLKRYLKDTIDRTRQVKTENKAVAKRLNTLVPDLMQSYDFKMQLLSDITKQGFTSENYQRLKQKAMLESMKNEDKKPRRAQRRSAK